MIKYNSRAPIDVQEIWIEVWDFADFWVLSNLHKKGKVLALNWCFHFRGGYSTNNFRLINIYSLRNINTFVRKKVFFVFLLKAFTYKLKDLLTYLFLYHLVLDFVLWINPFALLIITSKIKLFSEFYTLNYCKKWKLNVHVSYLLILIYSFLVQFFTFDFLSWY